MKLPVMFDSLTSKQKLEVRREYVRRQKGKCCICHLPFTENSPYANIPLNIWKFKVAFFKNHMHLHHDHNTGLTVGACHAVCNAYSRQYLGI